MTHVALAAEGLRRSVAGSSTFSAESCSLALRSIEFSSRCSPPHLAVTQFRLSYLLFSWVSNAGSPTRQGCAACWRTTAGTCPRFSMRSLLSRISGALRSTSKPTFGPSSGRGTAQQASPRKSGDKSHAVHGLRRPLSARTRPEPGPALIARLRLKSRGSIRNKWASGDYHPCLGVC